MKLRMWCEQARILTVLIALCAMWSAPSSLVAQSPDGKTVLPPGAVVAPLPIDSTVFLGRVSGTIYTNEFFALRFDVPSGWDMYHPDAAFRREIAGQSKRLAADSQRTTGKKVIETERVTPLVITGPVPAVRRAPAPFVVCVAEYLPGATAKTTAREFYERMRRDMAGAALRVVIDDQVSDEQIGGRSFVVYGTRAIAEGGSRQQHMVTVINGYALAFTLNHRTDEELKKLRELIPRIKFTT